MTTKAGRQRSARKSRGETFTAAERAIGVGVGCFLGALAGLMLGVGLACFGLTMWLWLVLPVTGIAVGGTIGWNFPFPLGESEAAES